MCRIIAAIIQGGRGGRKKRTIWFLSLCRVGYLSYYRSISPPAYPPLPEHHFMDMQKNALFICKSIKGNIYSRSVDDAIDYTPAAQWGKGEPRGWGRRARGVERFWIFSFFFCLFSPAV